MFKIAGELTACVFYVAARAIATQALSIFGDHSDIMAVRSTGFAMLSAASVQEAHDLALVAQAATLEARVPFIHFTDGFRTSHEVNTFVMLSDEQMRAMIDDDLVRAHRQRALSPERPVIRGTAQNPDTFFQARETVNPYYLATPGIVQRAMDRLAALTGRQYHLFRYDGHPEAERVVVVMGSAAAETLRATAAHLGAQGERVGVLQVLLYRPWSAKDFLAALPASVRRIAVLDRAKEPGRRPSRSVSTSRRPWPTRRPRRAHTCRSWSAAVRPVVEGFHPGDGQGGLRPSREGTVRAPASPSASSTMSAERASPIDASFDIEPPGVTPRAVLRPWLRRHRRGQQEQRQDPGRGSGPLCARILRL